MDSLSSAYIKYLYWCQLTCSSLFIMLTSYVCLVQHYILQRTRPFSDTFPKERMFCRADLSLGRCKRNRHEHAICIHFNANCWLFTTSFLLFCSTKKIVTSILYSLLSRVTEIAFYIPRSFFTNDKNAIEQTWIAPFQADSPTLIGCWSPP